MTIRDYFALRKARKAFKDLLNTYRLYADIMPEKEREALEERFADIKQALRVREVEDLPSLLETTSEELEQALPKRRFPWLSDCFDVVVSALAVAFCFRAYFYEPFQIPTGSMQPTLYGIHTEDAAEPTAWDKQPLRFLKWCATGTTFEEVRIREPGVVTGRESSTRPGYQVIVVNGRDRYRVPEDVFPLVLKKLYESEGRVRRNQKLWSGYVRSGDFLFVNRWIWNFRHPRLGETMVFSTRDLKGLPPNQHYIKRLCGRPGDTVEIKEGDSHLWVNGKEALQPPRLAQIAEHERPWNGAPQYLGYQPGIAIPAYPEPQKRFELGAGEYLALGDNSGNSLDSRYWGTVKSENLLGPASFVHWPFTSPRWGKIQ